MGGGGEEVTTAMTRVERMIQSPQSAGHGRGSAHEDRDSDRHASGVTQSLVLCIEVDSLAGRWVA